MQFDKDVLTIDPAQMTEQLAARLRHAGFHLSV